MIWMSLNSQGPRGARKGFEKAGTDAVLLLERGNGVVPALKVFDLKHSVADGAADKLWTVDVGGAVVLAAGGPALVVEPRGCGLHLLEQAVSDDES